MTLYIENRLKDYIYDRNMVIDKLEKGQIDKAEFLFENFMLLTRYNIKPFFEPDTIEKCLYNYQYYNTLAKYYRIYPDKRQKRKNINLVNLYYLKKDKTILSMIRNKEVGKLSAYPLLLHSKKLNGLLYEIVLLNHEKIILHSLNEDIRSLLIEMNVYDERPRESLISDYINSSY